MSRAAARPAEAHWIEATARVLPRDVEAVADALREAGAAGVAIEPAIRVSDTADFAYEELDAPSTVRASFPAPLAAPARRALRRRLAALPLSESLPPLRYVPVGPRAWSDEWKRFYHVQHAGERLVVRPSWEPHTPRPGEVVVELDPGTAFGTGQHETTRLCLAAIERALSAASEAMDVLDVGAGSGILSIAAALLGARRVRGIDNDAETIAIARENAARNGLAAGAGRVMFEAGAAERDWPWPDGPEHTYVDLLVSNISSTAVVAMMPWFARALRPGGTAVLSGFIGRDTDEVRAAALAAGLDVLRVDAEGEWRCLVAARRA